MSREGEGFKCERAFSVPKIGREEALPFFIKHWGYLFLGEGEESNFTLSSVDSYDDINFRITHQQFPKVNLS